jgi:hypothetical protein
MSRRGRSARKARAARQRAAAAARSKPTNSDQSRSTASWPPLAAPGRPNPREACVRLEQLAAARDDPQAAVDLEVIRLRGLGIGWVPIAAALKISRQGARQRYGRLAADS